MGHLNIRSLLRHFYDFKHTILDNNFDICAVSETRLDDSIPDSSVSIDGYKFIRCDRYRNGGGVGVYLRSHIKCSQIETDEAFEQLWLRLDSVGTSVAFGVIYRPPGGYYRNFFDMFENVIATIVPTVDKIICVGDFNVDLLETNTTEARYVVRALESLGLYQIIDQPTRITDTTESLLDYILTSDLSFATGPSVLTISREVSDHDLIYCSLKFANKKPPPIFKTCRDFKHLNYENFKSDLLSIPWDSIYHLDNVDSKVEFLNEGIVALLNIHAPFKTYKITKRYAPWLTDTLKEMMSIRDLALRRYKITRISEDWKAYKQLRNIVTVAVKREKKIYYNSKLNQCNSRTAWPLLKSLDIISRKSLNLPPGLANVDDINNHFVESVPKLSPPEVLLSYYNDNLKSSVTTALGFKEVSEMDILKIIADIKTGAVGCDGINISTIKLCMPHLLPHVTHIINFCLRNSVFPDIWKRALVIPLPKKAEPQNYSDIRPISILPTFSKILEKVMASQLQQHLDQNHILPVLQSGFRANHSCCTSLLNITDEIITATDRGKLTVLVTLDYSKAFDTLNHNLLNSILHYSGLSVSASKMLSRYLEHRYQAVTYSGNVSGYKDLSCGVPQGSILGPILFTIYISNFGSASLSSTLHFYADDSQLMLSFHPDEAAQAVAAINYDLSNICNISQQHCLRLNVRKSAAIVFGRKNDRLFFTRQDQNLLLNDEIVEYTDSIKNLGLVMDSDLRFVQHVSKCLQKAYLNLRIIYQHKSVLNKKSKTMLCESLVLSHVNFCDVVYGPCLYSVDIKRIQRLQNSCLRLIFGIRKFDHISHAFKSIRWLKMHDRRYVHSVILFLKILTHKTPPYLLERVSYRCDVHNLNLRFRGALTPPIHYTEIFKRSFSYNIVRLVNSLPIVVRDRSNYKIKRDLYCYLMREQFGP